MSKIYIYHHNDHDGIIAAGILYDHLLKVVKVSDEDIVFNMIDYDMELNFDHISFRNRDKVYFLDYSFSNEHNRNEFKKLLDRRIVQRDVKWIDHHKSSIDLFSDYEIDGIRDTSLCGAAWTYLWCNGLIKTVTNVMSQFDTISNTFHKSSDVPKFLKYIDDYDCWKKIYPETNDFHYGFTVSNPYSPIINVLLSDSKRAENKITNYINAGKMYQKISMHENRNYHIDMYGFEYKLPEEHGGLRCFCINRKGNSLMFGTKINEYDAVIAFYYTNGKWKYSIYSGLDSVDCSEIAKTYGGGGHKGAAGWVIDEFIFKQE